MNLFEDRHVFKKIIGKTWESVVKVVQERCTNTEVAVFFELIKSLFLVGGIVSYGASSYTTHSTIDNQNVHR